MAEQFALQGIETLVSKFGLITYDIKYKGGRSALRKAANLVTNAAKQNAQQIDDPKTREMIHKNIVVRFGNRRFKSTGDLQFRVGILGGARMTSEAQRKRKKRRSGSGLTLEELGEIAGKGKNNPGGDTFYWRFPEFGTERTSATPFMRPALENNVGPATNEFVSNYRKSIDRILKRKNTVR